jgi:uncharacterized caspase-like protein
MRRAIVLAIVGATTATFLSWTSYCFAAEQRIALVIGIKNYTHLPQLTNTIADAELISAKLRATRFDVTSKLDVSKDELRAAVTEFAERIAKIEAGGDEAVALIYYAGHGVQDDNQSNYLIGVDADIHSQVSLPLEALSLENVLETIQSARPHVAFAIFDACRDNPLPITTSRGSTRGLAVVGERRGLLIAFSTEPGKTALDAEIGADGKPGPNSPFAAALARFLDRPGIEATQLFTQVSQYVLGSTMNRQFPWIVQRLTKQFFFRPGPVPTAASTATLVPEPRTVVPEPRQNGDQDSSNPAELDFGRAVLANTSDAYTQWLRQYPDHPRKQTVLKLLHRLTEEQLWKRAESATSREAEIDGLEFLLDAFNDGVYAEKANARLAVLKSVDAAAQQAATAASGPPADAVPVVASPTATIRWYQGMDAPGNDLGQWIRNVADTDACMRICTAERSCVGVTYNARYSVCILKARIAPLIRAKDAAATGVLTDRTSVPTMTTNSLPQVQRYPNMDAPGYDRGSWIPNVSGEDCEALRVADPGCAGYTYNIAKLTCIPKNAMGSLVKSHDPALTGVVQGRN